MGVTRRFRLYVDESGDHTYRTLDEPSKRYLGLVGVLLEFGSPAHQLQDGFEDLKRGHFRHDPDEPVIFHRRELVRRRAPFHVLRDPASERAFNEALLQLLGETPFTVIGVVIDKKAHVERYGETALHPYHYCLAVLLERSCGLLNHIGGRGDVMAESRGGTEDMELKRAYHEMYERGTRFRGPNFFQRSLTSVEIKLKRKEKNVAGLQLADLLAFPLKQEILLDNGRILDPGDVFGSQICRTIGPKLNRHLYNGRIGGYGKIFLA